MVTKEQLIQELRTCYDPEIPVNIYDLGLIYALDLDDKGKVGVKMTLTSPNCPVAGSLPQEIRAKLKEVPGVSDVTIELVWDPPWCSDLMSEAARLQLGLL